MRASKLSLAAGALLALAITAQAGEFNRILKIGDPGPTWSNLPGVDDKTHSLADLKDKEVVVVVVTCNHCPIAQAYEDRIVAFAKKSTAPRSKVALVAICVSKMDEDLLPRMKERARAKGFSFPYIRDDSQAVGRAYGASATPEFFVLNKERKIVYMGAMDDNTDEPRVNFLEQAVVAVLDGKTPPKPETKPFGCAIQYERK
jgi:peroxiredoxin